MKKELQSNVNGMTSGGGSIQHPFSIHSASIGSRWKVHGLQSLMMTILLLFTMGIGQMWGTEAVFTGPTDLSGSWVKGKSFTITTTTNGVIADNTVYYSTSEGKVDNNRINPYRVGFVFKPQVNCTLTITAKASSTGKSCTHLIYEVNDSLYNLYKDAAGKYMTAYILSNYSEDENQIALWKAVSVIKNNPPIANGDSAKVLCGTTVKTRVHTLKVTSKSQSISNSADQVYKLVDGEENDIILEAGKKYLMFTNTGSTGVALKSLTFTQVASSGPSVSAFSPATGAKLKTGATVTVTGSTGSTVYCMWASSAPANAAAVVSGGTAGTAGAATVTSSGIASANGTTLYAVAVKDATNSAVASASYTIDDTAPTFSSSTPANSATGVATSGTIVLTFSEALASVDGSKFTLTGATKGTVVVDGTDATKVNVPYSGAGSEATVTLSVTASAVADAAGNALAADLSDISFTTAAAAPCPSSGILFSASVAATSKLTVDANTTNQLLTVSQATVSGGSMYVTNNEGTAKDLIAQSGSDYYFTETNNTTFFKIVLDCDLQEGDVIQIDAIGGTRVKSEVTYELGVWFSSASSRPGSAPAAAGTSSSTSLVENLINYTVTSADEYVGKNTFYIYRAYGATQYFGDVTITRPAPAVNYTVTINPNGGSYESTPDGWTYSAGVYTKSIAGGTSFSAPAGLTKGTDELSWKDGEDHDITFPQTISGNITFVAQWTPYVPSADATLSALSVAGCTLNETFDPETEDYTVDLPFYGVMPVAGGVTATKNDEHAETPAVSISGNVITVHCVAESGAEKDYTVTVTIAPAPTASSSINIEQAVLDNGKSYDIGAALTTVHISYVDKDDLDSLKNQSGRNEPYLGLKFKKTTSKVTIVVPASTALNVKFGYIDGSAGLKVSVNGSAAAAPSLTSGVYTLAASAGVKEVVFTQTGAKTVVYKQIMVGEDVQTVTLPWKVTYTPGSNGTCAKAYDAEPAGTPVTLPNVTPNDPSVLAFNGWYTAASEGTKIGDANDSYTPTADIELFAQYAEVPNPFGLTALTYQIGAGAATAVGYEAGTYTYNIKLPYAPSYETITVAATLADGTSSIKEGAVWTVTSLPGAATFTIVGAGAAGEQAYTVNFSMNAKDGLSIIETKVTGQNAHGPVGGLIGGDAAVAVASNYKLNSGNYVGVTLAGSNKFQAGDIVVINVTNVENATGFTLYTTNGADSALIIDTRGTSTIATGLHYITLPETYPDGVTPYAGTPSVYLLRADNSTTGNMNPRVDSIAVLRAMNPVLKAIRFNSTDVAVTSTSVSATLPNGTNLGTMTVTPTIAWNGAGTSVVTSNEGAWKWGDNTYVVTDKDGDATTYTITLTEDVIKHTVSFNTHEGTTVDPVEVEHNGYLAAAPTAPTKEDYIFQYWSLTDGGAEVDVTTVQIDEDKTFHAVWASDGAIKLIVDALPSGKKINDEAYYTGSPLTTVEISEVETPCVKLAGGATAATAPYSADKNDNRVIAYCATTTATKIQVIAYSSSTSARPYTISFVEEGQTADQADDNNVIVNLPTDKTIHTSDWYTFNSSNNRTIYITIPGNAGDYHFLQVKVIESGTPIKKAGDLGYSMNFNIGRPIGVKQTLHKNFEGFDFYANNDYKVLQSTSMVISNATNDYIKFHAAAPMTLAVTTENANSFYVTKNAKGTANETLSTAGGTSYIDLDAAADWYISPKGGDVKITNIAFIAPKCEMPNVTDMANVELCEGNPFTALSVTASVTDGGTLHYAWFKEAGETDEAVGTDAATYTPTADGQYYVVVTNQLVGYSDNSKTSNTITVQHFAAAEITTAPLNQRGLKDAVVTLTVAATGKNVAYKWYTCDEDGSNEVALDPEQIGTSLNVTITEGMLQWYKVKVTSDCGGAEAKAKVEEFVPATPANVTESILWDWKSTTAGFPTENSSIDFANTSVEELLANVSSLMPNNDAFHSDMLYGIGQRAWRKSDNDGECGFQGFQLRFHTEVAGRVRVYFRAPSSGQTSVVRINGNEAGSRGNSWGWSQYVYVDANSDVVIAMTNGETGMTRVQKIEFLALAHQRTTGYAAGDLGTVCLEDATIIDGANLYELAGLDQYGYLAFDQILSGELEAGKPYLFEVTNPSKISFYKPVGAAHSDDEIAVKGMIGTFAGTTLYQNVAQNYYYFSGRHIWRVNDFTVAIPIPAHRCYVDMDVLKNAVASSSPLPGRRRVTLGVNGKNAPTAIDNAEATEEPRKVMINGELFILRGEKMYDATGRLVK